MRIEYHSIYYMCTGPDNMYVYEGEDYSKCSDEDKKSFDQLLAGIRILCLSFRCTISIFLHWDGGGARIQYVY